MGRHGRGLATVVGRYYAMDRDHRAERTELARAALVDGVGGAAARRSAAVEASYAAGVTDEFVEPVVLGGHAASAIPRGDPLRVLQLPPRPGPPDLPRAAAGLRPAGDDDPLRRRRSGAGVRSTTCPLTGTLADALAAAGAAQLHVAETEKYAHVTYFFDGGSEHRARRRGLGLVRLAARCPDLRPAPEMAAAGVATLLREHSRDGYAFAIVNLANPDMVGHTGVLPAVIAAVEASDAALGVILAAVEQAGGIALVTADHGNAEQMLEPDGSPHTAAHDEPGAAGRDARGRHLRAGGSSAISPRRCSASSASPRRSR